MKEVRYYPYEPACVLQVSGPDARDFLQGQFSNDLKRSVSGETVYGLWLDRKGKIVADSFVQCQSEECFWVVSYCCPEKSIFDRLDAYLIMEDVEIECRASSCRGVAIEGLDGEKLASVLGDERKGVIQFPGRRGGDLGFLEVIACEEEGISRIEKLNAWLLEEGALLLEEGDLLALAIDSSLPIIGQGFGEDDLPQEIGLVESSVSFNKGCYLGQEVMARIRAMGKVRKSLRVCSSELSNTLSFEGESMDLLDQDGKRQGQLRTWLEGSAGGKGLAVVSEKFEGDTLYGGGTALRIESKDR